MYFLYILKNSRGELYKGITNNVSRRLKQHNDNMNPGTRGKGPWIVIRTETYDTINDARRREKFYKSGYGREKLKRILKSSIV